MFKTVLPLNAEKQATLRLGLTTDWRFCAGELLMPLTYPEMADAAREYPLVFLKNKPLYYALLGIEQGVNAYVAEDGHWRAHYVPARLRAYPFALAAIPGLAGQAGRFSVVMDAGALPALHHASAPPLFVAGQPGDALLARKALLEAGANAEPTTRRMVQAIRSAGLLVERAVQVRQPSPEHPALGGFEVVDEKKLNALPGEAFAALRQAGALPLVYAHLLSMANLRQGPLAGKYPELSPASQAVRPVQSMDALLAGLAHHAH